MLFPTSYRAIRYLFWVGHKLALKDYREGDTVIKYGVDIGKVVKPIAKGEHLHVHNVKTKRW